LQAVTVNISSIFPVLEGYKTSVHPPSYIYWNDIHLAELDQAVDRYCPVVYFPMCCWKEKAPEAVGISLS
jgi:hypothetical protein